jgi:uncharacterized membrane protein YfcA
MDPLTFVAAVAAIAMASGVLGAIFGLGGGVFLVPALTLYFGVNIRYAIGASLMAIIATSCGASAAFVRDGVANVRVGMLLELAAVLGALTGAMIAGLISARWLFIIFGLLMLYAIYPMVLRGGVSAGTGPADPVAIRLGLSGAYRERASLPAVPYVVRRVRAGAAIMFGSGVVSGLLGIGGGIFNVLAMVLTMGLPLKVGTATSSFMIGVIGAASAGVYFSRGLVHPLLAAPVVIGILAGARTGAVVARHLPAPVLRWLFLPVLIYIGLSMLQRGLR